MRVAPIAAAAAIPKQPEARRSLKADTLAASVIILLTVTVVQRTVGFGRGILFCRWLSPESLGEWEMVYSFLMLAAPLAVLGVPGSFGRYAEHYRQRGHLRTFLNRTTIWTAVCGLISVAVIEGLAPQLSDLMFGDAKYADVMRNVGFCLLTIIVQHTLTALLTALRLYRIVSAMQFAQSILFAIISLGLMWRWPTMNSILFGYAIACLASSAGAIVWAWPAFRDLDRPEDDLVHREFWGKLLRFAFFVWVTNLLTHLFAIVDRYMIVHYANLSPTEALQQVGHYHSSRIIPLLMVSVADLLSGLVMPHLTHDWEAGRPENVSKRLNLTIKLSAICMMAFGVAVLASAPLLFHTILQGKYDDGLHVLPWTMAGCVWYGIYVVAQNYLWCAEKAKLSTAPLMIGLLVNVVLNFILLPTQGLHGAVLATAISTCICLLVVLWLNQLHGMQVDRGAWLLALAPTALGFGLWPSVVTTLAVLVASLATPWLLTELEQRELKHFAVESLTKFLPALRRERAPAAS
ncbi:lipopolysaccharide biosynthesis protein [Lacipirellula limnantheis]|uniref:MurJ-like flippase n=1 Tax=Lacipirellula limnantheis TaxID=2528024 RepID=A0A517TZY0_9BACT|nr:oligosaccharide flippase family protein [Lacipirellula limnantheis]QDT73937.1 MurJ-like flippase [Lacipirellula limnantheis]